MVKAEVSQWPANLLTFPGPFHIHSNIPPFTFCFSHTVSTSLFPPVRFVLSCDLSPSCFFCLKVLSSCMHIMCSTSHLLRCLHQQIFIGCQWCARYYPRHQCWLAPASLWSLLSQVPFFILGIEIIAMCLPGWCYATELYGRPLNIIFLEAAFLFYEISDLHKSYSCQAPPYQPHKRVTVVISNV